MQTQTVKLPNGNEVQGTFRNDWSDAGYVRVMTGEKGERKLTTISGRIDGDYFIPRGQNAHLIQG